MIQVSHLKKTYSNGLQVLRDVNATIEKGEVISIIGPSGTGKSTFLRCLNLLEKPTGGSIIVDGQDLLSKRTDVPKLRQKMVSDNLDKMGCTRVVIAHRLSTIRHCDRIIVLDKGRIAEEGTYEALKEKGGLFAEMIKRQEI